jgi:hypothetical protein
MLLAPRIELAAFAPTDRSKSCPFRGQVLFYPCNCQMIANPAAPARINPPSRTTTEVLF